MKIFLDDMRVCPENMVLCRWPVEVISIMETSWEEVTEVSLDHDLGDTTYTTENRKEITGYDVLLYIEEKVFTENKKPPILKVHSSNASARMKMEIAIQNIYRIWDSK